MDIMIPFYLWIIYQSILMIYYQIFDWQVINLRISHEYILLRWSVTNLPEHGNMFQSKTLSNNKLRQ